MCIHRFRLPVHIENSQQIRFVAVEDLEQVVSNEQRSKTMLSEFFASNAGDSSESSYLYNKYPEHFIWDGKNKCWKPAKRGVVIGRVAHSSPAKGERYYLRLLLGNVRAQSLLTT